MLRSRVSRRAHWFRASLRILSRTESIYSTQISHIYICRKLRQDIPICLDFPNIQGQILPTFFVTGSALPSRAKNPGFRASSASQNRFTGATYCCRNEGIQFRLSPLSVAGPIGNDSSISFAPHASPTSSPTVAGRNATARRQTLGTLPSRAAAGKIPLGVHQLPALSQRDEANFRRGSGDCIAGLVLPDHRHGLGGRSSDLARPGIL